MPIRFKAHDFFRATCEVVNLIGICRTVKNISFTFRLFSIIHTDIRRWGGILERLLAENRPGSKFAWRLA